MNNKILLAALALMVGVIGVMSWKVKTAGGYAKTFGNENISFSTSPSPLRLGQASFLIDVRDKNGKPVDDAIVSYEINMTTMNMGAQQGIAVSQGKGRYIATGNMSMRGPWRVRTSVKMPDGSTKNKSFEVNVP